MSSEPTPSLDQAACSVWPRMYRVLFWTRPGLRWQPERPAKMPLSLNLLFGIAAAITVANLYYNHAILNILAKDFNVPYDKVSEIPTLAQAGYAVGLFFLCPLGDLVKRRPFVLSLVFITATLTIVIATARSINSFVAVQFIIGVTTVTPQIMLPLAGDLAPPERRATVMSIVISGAMLGVLIARLLSGIVANYTSWRNVYWLSVGLQYAVGVLLWFFMPDYPSVNPGMNYFQMLWSVLTMLIKHPIIVQSCLFTFFLSATFTGFWTTLTFLLSGSPYFYNTVDIGLFALVGIASLFIGPFYSRYVIDRFDPSFSVLLSIFWSVLGVTIGTFTGTFTVAGPILQAFFGDFGVQTGQIANRAALFSVEPKGRNRVNTAFMVSTFLGQLVGTIVEANLYVKGGWIASGSYSLGSIGAALVIALLRGPRETGWAGWTGGWRMSRNVAREEPVEAHTDQTPEMSESHEGGTKEESA